MTFEPLGSARDGAGNTQYYHIRICIAVASPYDGTVNGVELLEDRVERGVRRDLRFLCVRELSGHVRTPLDNASYFEKLVQSVTRIVRHTYYPGKVEAIELCLEELDDLQAVGRISSDQRSSLRELLMGEEDRALVEGVIREREHPESVVAGERIAVFCEGAGSLGAFSAGVLEGLLEHARDLGEIITLGGTGFGALSALLAWEGLLRSDPSRAVNQLQRFWRDYAAGSFVDGLMNYSAQMLLQLRTLVSMPGVGPFDVSSISLDQLRRLVERQVDSGTARALAQRDQAPGLAVNSLSAQGAVEVVRGPEIHLEPILAATSMFLFADAAWADPGGDFPTTSSPLRALFDSFPSELWLVQVRRVGRARPSCVRGELADIIERHEHQMLEQELRFVQTMNRLLKRGVLLGDQYRPVEIHRIIMEHDLDDSARVNRSPGLIEGLITHGKERACQFLEKRRQSLSKQAHPHLER